MKHKKTRNMITADSLQKLEKWYKEYRQENKLSKNEFVGIGELLSWLAEKKASETSSKSVNMETHQIESLKLIIRKQESEIMRISNITKTYQALLEGYKKDELSKDLRDSIIRQFQDICLSLDRCLFQK